MREIGRSEWNELRPNGGSVDDLAVSVRSGYVDVEGDGGRAHVTVHVVDDGVDVRIHNLQLCVQGSRVKVMQTHPPYPVTRWTVLWEGEMTRD